MQNSKAKKWAAVVLAVVLAAVALFAVACQKKEVLVLDENNENGTSQWSSLPLINAEAKAKGYLGGGACQHLTFLARSPQNKNLLFFGTDAAGLWRSKNGGKSWEQCNKGLFNSGVSLIAIDPLNDSHIVVFNAASSVTTSKYTATYYSFDGGDNWQRSDGTYWLGISSSQYYYDSLKFDPTSYNAELGYCTDIYFATPCERDTVFVGAIRSEEEFMGKRGLYVSKDGGKTFEKKPDSEIHTDSIIETANGKIVLANMNGIYVLNGNNIVKKSDMDTHSLLYTNGQYYILTEQGIYTSKNLESFQQLQSDNFSKMYFHRNLAVSSKNPQCMMLYARKSETNKYSYRPYYSHDGGKTWTLSELQNSPDLFYYYTYHAGITSFDPDDENVIISIIGGEVIRSTDGGETFHYYGDGVNNVSIGGQFHFNVYDEDLVYVGAYDFGGALTTDGGKTWQNISLSKDGDGKDIMGGYAASKDVLFGVYVDTWSPGSYFRDYRYVCYSHDGGKTVNINSAQIKEDPTVYNDLNIDHTLATAYESSYQSPTNSGILFCANYRSTDFGHTWKNMLNSTAAGEKCLQVYTHNGATLYGCSKQSGFVLKSNDNGATWQKVNQTELTRRNNSSAPSHIADIAVDSDNGYIYAAYDNKLWRMTLDGNDITDLTRNMPKDNFGTYRIRTVAVDPNFKNIVYTGGSGDFYMSRESVQRSFDCGNSWVTMINSNSQNTLITSGQTLGYEARCLRIKKDGTVWCSCLCLGMCKLSPPYTVQYVKKSK